MKRLLCVACALLLVSLWAAGGTPAAEAKLLWQIGKPDNNDAEFALAPSQYAKYTDDPLFVVGLSDPRRDWPYVHPGPGDPWAGGRPHTFTILFFLAEKPQGGPFRLLVDLIDTHNRMPPKLGIRVNDGKVFAVQTPPGAGDASVFGDPAKGKEHRFTLTIPASALRAGANEMAITTLEGCWALYDRVGFEAPEGVTLAPPEKATLIREAVSQPLLRQKDGKLVQTVEVTVRHLGEPAEAVLLLSGAEPAKVSLQPGTRRIDVDLPAVEAATSAALEIRVAGKTVAATQVAIKPVRRWTVYLLAHSHVDIGYTKLQTLVEKDHWQYLEQAIEASRRTASNPPGSQFKWNVEVLWAVESYLNQATPEKRQRFLEAVKKGWVGLDALLGNELTALCRPEELVRLVDYAQRLSRECGVTIDSAMISDVPGYTWGLTSVFAAGGVKYMSIGPNGGDRIGYTLEAWADKPFWWLTPDGRHKVLCWIPSQGYVRAFTGGASLLEELRRHEARGYPYDMIQVRYCLGDNQGPALGLCELVKQWNEKHAYPKLVIGTTSEMMHEFERRWGDKLPQAKGDFTPYWEDGAASSARETGLNRAAAERLSQAEALFAMLQPGRYPAGDFAAAWRNVVLYDEHTWGAHNSISEPDSKFVLDQWKIKQKFALDADRQSAALLDKSSARAWDAVETFSAVYVYNTSSWPRTDLVKLPCQLRLAGDVVVGPDGALVPSQRLASHHLVFLAADVPPLGAKRFTFVPGKPSAQGDAKADAGTLGNGRLQLKIDPKSGAIASLRAASIAGELVDARGGMGLNDYRYVPGKNPRDAKPAGPVKIAVKNPGPLVASLGIEGPAPGCRKLTREIRLVHGLDRVEILDTIDKEKVRTKEGVHFAFPFNVPQGVMRIEAAWSVVRPETDQLPGSCKNWFTVDRWVDVSNEQYGVTWATVDAPLVEVGAITAEIPWIRTIEPSQTLYSYVMNNYWHTNYKADQEGYTQFRYAIRPHQGGYHGIEAARFGIEASQPLVASSAAPDAPAVIPSRLRVAPDDVIVTALKPSRDGKAIIVRLTAVGGRDVKATLTWGDPVPNRVSLSNLAEEALAPVTGPIEVPAMGLVTLRAELS